MYATLGMLIGGGVAVAFPTLALRQNNPAASPTTTRTINLPAGITAGQRIVLVIALSSGSIITPPSGYTQVSGQNVYQKLATGTEGASINFSVSNSIASSNHAALVFNGAAQVAASAPVTAATANANAPSLTVPWGATKNLFMAIYFGMASGSTISALPANCPLYHWSTSVSGADAYHAGAESLLATFDPDPFTTGANDHKAYTIGVAA